MVYIQMFSIWINLCFVNKTCALGTSLQCLVDTAFILINDKLKKMDEVALPLRFISGLW